METENKMRIPKSTYILFIITFAVISAFAGFAGLKYTCIGTALGTLWIAGVFIWDYVTTKKKKL